MIARKTPLIIQSTGTEFDYASYLQDEQFKPIRRKVNERVDTVSDTEVNSRVIHHWSEIGLLPSRVDVDSGGWRKFTLIERVWLEAIKRMRAFGLPLDYISKACDEIMEWNDALQTYLLFEYYVVKAWFTEMDPYILILADGGAAVGSIADIESTKVLRGHKDMLLISLKSILEEMGLNVKKAAILFDLTNKEIELLSQLRVEGVSEVTAKANKATGDITDMETRREYTEKPPLDKINKEFRDEKAFGEVITKTAHGKKQSAIVKKRKVFK